MKLLYDLIFRMFPKTDKDRLAVSLAFGLAAGLTVGLTAGFVAILTIGLAASLAYGLTAGIAFGLLAGLAYGSTRLVPSEYLPFAIGIILLAEAIFWLRKEPMLQKKANKFTHTVWMKFLAVVDSALIVLNLNNMRYLPFDELQKWFGYIGIAAIGLGILYGWIWLNSRKYEVSKK